MAERRIIASFDAVGGPAARKLEDDGYWAGRTDAGNYRIAYCAKHSSSRYADWSKVRWGSPLKEEKGELQVKHGGKWQPLKNVTRVTKAEIENYHRELYGTKKVPSTWVFNDFGHMTCYFFRDKNNNGRLDRDLGEKIHPEFFHTSPGDEADSAAGRPVSLSESHGCIHLKPKDIDDLIDKGYFKGGRKVVVHKYDEKLPALVKDASGVGPFVIHFYPGAKKLLVVGAPAKKK